jgi:ADP-ribosylglycohydrolase
MEGGYGALVELSAQVDKDGFEIKGCISCRYFRFSGMSYDMSAGWLGYCALPNIIGVGNPTRVDDDCGEHDLLMVWASDRAAAQEARVALWEENRFPSRIAAFAGTMVGLAVGDALGFPAEFRKRRQILSCFGPEGLTDFVALHDRRWVGPPVILSQHHPPGTYSDDTQMSLAVADALIESGRGDLDELMNAMGRHFVSWARSADNNRFPGSTCMAGCLKLESGVPWRDAGVADSKGCGSAMRAAPIGLYFWRNQQCLLDTARASSLLTHGHDAAIEATAAVALLVSLALQKVEPAVMYKILLKECGPRSSDFRGCLERLPSFLDVDPAEALSAGGIGEGWVAEEAVVAAFYCFWRSPDDFRRTVLTAVNTDGDSDSIACIAGAISGAFNGLNSIPIEWKKNVENARGLDEVARRLWETAP